MSTKQSNSLGYPFAAVVLATIALIVSNGLAIGGLPVFFKSIQNDLIESGAVSAQSVQSSFSIGPALTIMLAGFLAPLGGYLIGRIGTRKVMLIGCLLLGTGLFTYTEAVSLPIVYLAHALLGVSLCFVGVVPCSSLVSKWFDRGRGTALGIALTGTNFGAMLIPLMGAPLIATYGWRPAMLYSSALVWAVLLPVVVLLVRDPVASSTEEVENAVEGEGLSFREAIGTVRFAVLALAAALTFYAIFAVLQQFNLYMQSPRLGYDLGGVKVFMSTLALWTIAGKFAFGFLADRFGALRVICGSSLLMFASTLFMFDLTPTNIGLLAVAFGSSYGGTFVMLQMIVADLFGRREYPRILGALHFVQTIGGAVGLLATGYIADAMGGDFALAFEALVLITGVAVLLTVALNLFNRKSMPVHG